MHVKIWGEGGGPLHVQEYQGRGARGHMEPNKTGNSADYWFRPKMYPVFRFRPKFRLTNRFRPSRGRIKISNFGFRPNRNRNQKLNFGSGCSKSNFGCFLGLSLTGLSTINTKTLLNVYFQKAWVESTPPRRSRVMLTDCNPTYIV